MIVSVQYNAIFIRALPLRLLTSIARNGTVADTRALLHLEPYRSRLRIFASVCLACGGFAKAEQSLAHHTGVFLVVIETSINISAASNVIRLTIKNTAL